MTFIVALIILAAKKSTPYSYLLCTLLGMSVGVRLCVSLVNTISVTRWWVSSGSLPMHARPLAQCNRLIRSTYRRISKAKTLPLLTELSLMHNNGIGIAMFQSRLYLRKKSFFAKFFAHRTGRKEIQWGVNDVRPKTLSKGMKLHKKCQFPNTYLLCQKVML